MSSKKLATTKKRQHSKKHQELLKKQAAERTEVKEVLNFFNTYSKPLAAGIIVFCAVILVSRSIQTKRQNTIATAGSAMASAASPADLEQIVKKYSATPVGPIALMKLAHLKYNAGEIKEAEALYVRFKNEYSKHELIPQAELNLILCKEAKEQFGEAHLLYGEFAKTHKDLFLAPVAILGQARCLETLGMYEEARMAYDDVLTGYANTVWAQTAEAYKKVLLGKIL